MRKRNTENKNTKRLTSVMERSLYFVFFVILVLCMVLIGRIVYINNVDGERYTKAVLSQQSFSSTVITGSRGRILDRNGVVLAKSEVTYNVVINPYDILTHDYYIKPTLDALETTLGYDRDELERYIRENPTVKYKVFEKEVEYERVSKFKTYQNTHKFVVGITFEEEYKRVYPFSTLASHVIGFTNSEGNGTNGIEQYYNESLLGTDGLIYGYFDAGLNKQKTVKEAEDGNDIVSTIDYNIQVVVEEKVNAFIEETGCKDIGVIVMNPNNGEILAMASNEEYDLNNPRSLEAVLSEDQISTMTDEEQMNAIYKMWRNFCVSDTYEPGSTFKTITVASALEEDIIKTTDKFECIGYREVGGWKIGCNNKYGHGTLTLMESLMKSCNCALMEIASRMGSDIFYEYENRFGFGNKTGIDLTGEATGIIIPRNSLNATELATNSFGTTFNVTMVQIASAYASIMNGGTYYRPHVVKKIQKTDGTTVAEEDDYAVKQTISSSTGEFLKEAMRMTVESGTATPAKVEGYSIGGKTGTAQKKPKEEKKYVVSFVGCAPVENPQVMIYIVIDEIADKELAGSSRPATSMSAAIMKEILPYLGIYPAGEIEYTVDPKYLSDQDSEIYRPEEDEMNPDVLPEGYGE